MTGTVARPFAAIIAAAALLSMLMVAMVVSMFSSAVVPPISGNAPSGAAVAGIPSNYLQLYRSAEAKYGVDWAVLAAIGYVETQHGTSKLPGVRSGTNSYGCCAGPMQMCVIDGCPGRGPSQLSIAQAQAGTWRGVGQDGDNDGVRDPWNPADAIPAAAVLLKGAGAPQDYNRAIFAYNHAGWYVAEVQAKAAEYRGALVSTSPLGDATAQAIQAAADQLDGMRIPYRYGGGHVQPAVPNPGLDCSSSVSWVFQHAGINAPTMNSTALMSWGDPGPGRLITIYSNPGHVFMKIGNRFFGTSAFGHPGAGTGPAWFTRSPGANYLATFVMRHPPGL